MVIRQLPFEEWDKLDGFPIAQNGGRHPFYDILPNPEVSIIIVAETEGGEIVGTWSAVAPVVLEGLWVKEEYRKKGVFPKMYNTMMDSIFNMGITNVYTLVQTPDVKSLALKLGFEIIPGEFCMIKLNKEV